MQIPTLSREEIAAPVTSVPPKSRTHTTWLWLIPLLLLTMWLGTRGLNADGYWVDEVWSLRTAGGPTYGPLSLAETWQSVATIDAWQAPGFYLLLNVWGNLVGWTELATRTLSLLFGVLSVAMMYRLARDVQSPLAGIAAAVALMTSAFYVNFYHELRGYTLYIFLTALCMWSYWRLTQPLQNKNKSNRQDAALSTTTFAKEKRAEGKISIGVQIAFVLSVAGLLYTHYFASLTVVILGIYHVLFVDIDLKRWRDWRMWLRWGNRDWWRVGVLAGLAVLLFVPWLNVLLFATRLAQAYPRYTLPPDVLIQSILNSFSNGNLFLIILLALATLGIRGRSRFAYVLRPYRDGVLFAWTLVIGWCVVGLIAAYILIMGEVRYFMGVWVALALIAGTGVAQLSMRGVNPALLIGTWLLLNIWNIYNTGATGNVHWNGWHEPFRELSQITDGQLREGDTLFYQLKESVNAWYQEDVANYYLPNTPARLVLFEAQPNVPYTVYTAQAQDLVNGATRIWLALDPTTRPWRTDLLNQTFIDSGFTACGNFARVPLMSVDLYVNLALAPRSIAFTEPIANGGIEAALLHPLPEKVDASLPVILGWWQNESVPPETYSAALHVRDAAGNPVAQGEDYGLPNEAASCRITRINTSALPAGSYSISLIVYNWQTGASLEPGVLGTFTK